jgi:hypothetical protein
MRRKHGIKPHPAEYGRKKFIMRIIEIIKSNAGFFDTELKTIQAIVNRLHPVMDSSSNDFTGLHLTDEQAQATLELYERIDVAALTAETFYRSLDDAYAGLCEVVANGGIGSDPVYLMHNNARLAVRDASRAHAQIVVLRQSIKTVLDEVATRRHAEKMAAVDKAYPREVKAVQDE